MIVCTLPLGVLNDLIWNPLGLKDPSLCIISQVSWTMVIRSLS